MASSYRLFGPLHRVVLEAELLDRLIDVLLGLFGLALQLGQFVDELVQVLQGQLRRPFDAQFEDLIRDHRRRRRGGQRRHGQGSRTDRDCRPPAANSPASVPRRDAVVGLVDAESATVPTGASGRRTASAHPPRRGRGRRPPRRAGRRPGRAIPGAVRERIDPLVADGGVLLRVAVVRLQKFAV